MASLVRPFHRTYRYLQRQAHENPVLFYSCVIGSIGPLMVFIVPPVREKMGYTPAEMIPTTFPLPNRRRRSTHGYEDP